MADLDRVAVAATPSTMRPFAERRQGRAVPLLVATGVVATMLLGATGSMPWPAAMASLVAFCVMLELVESMRVRKPTYGAAQVQRRNSLVINLPMIAGAIATALGH